MGILPWDKGLLRCMPYIFVVNMVYKKTNL